jgi:hypothetical protein
MRLSIGYSGIIKGTKMQPVLVIPVQIPYYLFIQFKPLIDSLPIEAMQEWTDWRQDLYKVTRGKLPLVQYFVGSMAVPDVYGYFYTSWLALQGLGKVK